MFMTFAVAMMSTLSCTDEFLEVAPAGSLSQAELATLAGLEGSLIATYRGLLGAGFYGSADNWFWVRALTPVTSRK